MEKELARVLIGPVVGDGVAFLGVFLDEGYDAFEAAVVSDHFEGAVGSDFGDGVDVVASKEDAEIDELREGEGRGLTVPSKKGGSARFLLDFYPSPTRQVHDPDGFQESVLCAAR